jgi:hypothetical protein
MESLGNSNDFDFDWQTPHSTIQPNRSSDTLHAGGVSEVAGQQLDSSHGHKHVKETTILASVLVSIVIVGIVLAVLAGVGVFNTYPQALINLTPLITPPSNLPVVVPLLVKPKSTQPPPWTPPT